MQGSRGQAGRDTAGRRLPCDSGIGSAERRRGRPLPHNARLAIFRECPVCAGPKPMLAGQPACDECSSEAVGL